MEKEHIKEIIWQYLSQQEQQKDLTFEELDDTPFRCVLFDMDGVLYDSMPNHAIAWTKAMKSFGIEMTEQDAYLTEGQRGIDTIRQMVLAQKGVKIDEEEAQHMYDVKTHEFGLLPTAKIMPGVKKLMHKIKTCEMQIGIVTGSGQRPLIERLLRDFSEYVDEEHIVTAYDVKHGKPAPDPYLMGLEKAGGLRPDEGIVVENAPLGVRAGVAAGIFTIAVNSGPLPAQMLTQEGAGLVYGSMRELNRDWHHIRTCMLSRSDIWVRKCQYITDYMECCKRRPSKHRVEDHLMLNWLKYNKRMLMNGKMTAERADLFNHLLEIAEKYRKVNQNAYVNELEDASSQIHGQKTAYR